MTKLTFLVVGKLKESYWQEAIAEYQKRLSSHATLDIIELPEGKSAAEPSESEIQKLLESEGEEILRRRPKQSTLVALCIEGEQVSSESLAEKLRQLEQTSSHLVFVIGSSHGLSEQVKQASQFKLSISPMTFPHQLARVILAEQVYRAFSINNNSKYHK